MIKKDKDQYNETPPAVNRRMEFNKLGIAITIMIEVRSDVVIKYFISIRFLETPLSGN